MTQKKVMIVDDDVLIGSMIKRHLDKQGRKTAIAPTGEIALEQLKQECFDAVILDINLPGISGWDVLERMKVISPHAKAIMLTASCKEEDAREKALEKGAFDLITKPFYLRRLVETIDRALCDMAARQDSLIP